VAHDGGVPAPEYDSTMDATATGGAPPRTEPVAGASSSHTQMGATATSSDDDDDELEVVMGRPCLQAPKPTSLPKAVGMTQSALRLVQ
jgi:hypothetical protein